MFILVKKQIITSIKKTLFVTLSITNTIQFLNKNDTILSSNFKLTYFLFIGIALCIPLSKVIISPLLILLVIVSFRTFIKNKYTLNKRINKSTYLLVLFYGLHVVSYFLSHNTAKAAFDLQIKLSFIILPLCYLLNENIQQVKLKSLTKAFVLGNFIASILCVTYGLAKFNITQSWDSFFYSELSYFHHPSYYAMYVCITLFAIGYRLHRNYNHLFWLKMVGIAWCIIMLLLLNSKTGIVVLLLLIPIGGYYLVYLKQSLIRLIALTVFFIGLMLVLLYTSESLSYRVKEAYLALTTTTVADKNKHLSTTTMRQFIWNDALLLIKQNKLGYSTGDVNYALVQQYKISGNTQAANAQLNAHNQFLQTTLALGVVGLFVLLSLLIYPLLTINKSIRVIYLFFILIVSVNFLTESILETQSGIVFFVAGYCIIINTKYNSTNQLA